jgi:hypothetical protein
MCAGAQALGMDVSNMKSLKEAYRTDGSLEMREKIFKICYHGTGSGSTSWEVRMEQNYMKEKNIVYSVEHPESNKREIKGCIARLISKRLNEMRAAIRKVGREAHQHSIQVRLDKRNTDGTRKRKSLASLVFDEREHVRSKVMASDTTGLAGEDTGVVADSDEVCVLHHEGFSTSASVAV